jgi:hypothetical protein
MNNYIYIDFEGFIGKPQSIVGELKNNNFKVYVFSETLQGIPDHKCEKCEISIVHMDLRTYLDNLIHECKANNKKIVAYSTRELDVFKECNVNEIEKYYINAHKEIKKWFSKNSIAKPKPFSLENLLSQWEFPTNNYGERKTTRRIRNVESGLKTHQNDFSNITTYAKSQWTKVLHYNRQDVEGLEFIYRQFLNNNKPFQT